MNFFDAQERARKSSRWLVVTYLLSTALIVAGVTILVGVSLRALSQEGLVQNEGVLWATAIITALLILGATLYKTLTLSSGGGRVAVELGGTRVTPDTSDPLRRLELRPTAGTRETRALIALHDRRRAPDALRRARPERRRRR